jgi:hypothetical protein
MARSKADDFVEGCIRGGSVGLGRFEIVRYWAFKEESFQTWIPKIRISTTTAGAAPSATGAFPSIVPRGVGQRSDDSVMSLSFMRGAPITPPITWSQGELDIIIAGGEITRPLILLSNQTWF